MAAVYLQCCSGGLFEGDDLRLRIEAGPQSLAHVATAAATLVHSARGEASARQEVEIEAREGAWVEYLPQAVILFPGARLVNRLRLRLSPGARVIATDSVLSHDPNGLGVAWDLLDSRVDLCDERGRLLARDALRMGGRDALGALPGVTGKYRAQGSIYFAGHAQPDGAGQARAGGLLEAMRARIDDLPGVYAGAGTLPGNCGLWARVLGEDAVALRRALLALVAVARSRAPGVSNCYG